MSALSVPDTLDNDLLGSLRGNPAKIRILDHLLMHITGLQVGIYLGGFLGGELGTQQGQFGIGHHQPASAGHIRATLAINGYLDVRLFVVAFLCRGRQSQFNRLKDNILRNAFFRRYRLSNHQDFFVHRIPLNHPVTGASCVVPLSSLPAVTATLNGFGASQPGLHPGPINLLEG